MRGLCPLTECRGGMGQENADVAEDLFFKGTALFYS